MWLKNRGNYVENLNLTDQRSNWKSVAVSKKGIPYHETKAKKEEEKNVQNDRENVWHIL